jgi:hypothetical protein
MTIFTFIYRGFFKFTTAFLLPITIYQSYAFRRLIHFTTIDYFNLLTCAWRYNIAKHMLTRV